MADDLPTLTFASQVAWETWLEAHYADPANLRGVWIKMAKKATGVASVSHAEALESALCYGWIDGQRNRLDETYFLQKFTPRRARSGWSRVNREKVKALIAQGRMRPAGLREVERAKADGRWDAAYEPQSAISVPNDLQRELDANPDAQAFFNTLDSRNRYAILYRLQTVKKPETRAARIQKFVAMLAQGQKIYP
jgi:uncharacterized protein YdeI (YjbR/CyaY-like superfamily)